MSTETSVLRMDALITTANRQVIAKIPKEQSKELLPSRGQVFVKGTVNGKEFSKVLEPDGYWSHWFRISNDSLSEIGVSVGDTINLEVTVSKNWPEPELPADIAAGLEGAPQKVKQKWHDITPMARWEWIRWVNSTASTATRAVRIEKTISKLNGSHRRPCCFNLAACTDPELSKSGRLVEV